MLITSEWLKKIKTPAGGYTKRQLERLGVTWPPPSGWARSLVGKHIDDAIAVEVSGVLRAGKGEKK